MVTQTALHGAAFGVALRAAAHSVCEYTITFDD
jgi:hypothetical protein